MPKRTRSTGDHFVALPVGQGDGFFYRRKDVSVLVDGGKAYSGVEGLLKRYADVAELDVVVCTHNDADHANGLLGLVSSGFPCKEVWLPGSWTSRLADLVATPADFTDELIANIEEASKDLQDAPAGRLLEWFALRREIGQVAEFRGSTEDLHGAIEAALELEEWPFRGYPLYPLGEFVFMRFRHRIDARARLLNESLAAGARIAEIAKAAYANGTQLRWFEYGVPADVAPNRVEPLRGVNCGEITRVPAAKLSALEYLALTTSNKQSLVFQSPTVGAPGALFTADSDLRFSGEIDWGQPMIVTAPHHGSEHNCQAYSRFEQDGRPSPGTKTWVRSDGRFQSRPGPSYLRQYPRFCTRCREQRGSPQAVSFRVSRGAWVKTTEMSSCACTPPT